MSSPTATGSAGTVNLTAWYCRLMVCGYEGHTTTPPCIPGYAGYRFPAEVIDSIKFCGVLRLGRLGFGCHLRPWPGTVCERLSQSAIQGPGAGLQEQVGASREPLHLLFLANRLAMDLNSHGLSEG